VFVSERHCVRETLSVCMNERVCVCLHAVVIGAAVGPHAGHL